MGSTPLLEAVRLSKTFGSRTVLREASLAIEPGEIHGLLGENGSGKSTLIKILAGYHAPDPGGSLKVGGVEEPLPLSPVRPRELGMYFVHQDLALMEQGTVLENMRIGRYGHNAAYAVNWRAEQRSVQETLDRYGVAAKAETMVSSLRQVDRAMVAIARALEQLRDTERGVLILDEPTPYLPRDGVDQLLASVRAAADTGVGVLFVSHRLEEIRAITDKLTILRDGAVVATAETTSMTDAEIIEKIIGFSLEQLYPDSPENRGERILSVRGVEGAGVHGVDLDLHEGEILGVTGLLGMGWERLPYALFGADPVEAGTMELAGKRCDLTKQTPRRSLDERLALIPANRQRDGSLPIATVTENVTLPTVDRYFRGGRMRPREEHKRAKGLIEEYDVRPPEPRKALGMLSGGNQQKAVLAKWLEFEPRVLMIHEPTQGVDIGARTQLFTRLRDVAAEGTALIIASTEYGDLAHLCDRVVVFRDGKIVAELSHSGLTEERLVERSFAVGSN
jgi:ribose transport system ATP-binding protein